MTDSPYNPLTRLARTAERRIPWLRRRRSPNYGRYFGLDGLDQRLAEHLPRGRGTFVEAGANDGVTQSNTAYLEFTRGWRGLLVEPVPPLAEACRANRPLSIVEQAALVPPDRENELVPMVYCGLMSVVDGSMKSEAEQLLHLRRGSEIQSLQTYELKVPGITLSRLLDRHGITSIDLLSLDVEGFEADALRGLDLSRHRPRYMLIEARFRDDIESIIGGHYDVATTLSRHDILYKARTR